MHFNSSKVPALGLFFEVTLQVFAPENTGGPPGSLIRPGPFLFDASCLSALVDEADGTRRRRRISFFEVAGRQLMTREAESTRKETFFFFSS